MLHGKSRRLCDELAQPSCNCIAPHPIFSMGGMWPQGPCCPSVARQHAELGPLVSCYRRRQSAGCLALTAMVNSRELASGGWFGPAASLGVEGAVLVSGSGSTARCRRFTMMDKRGAVEAPDCDQEKFSLYLFSYIRVALCTIIVRANQTLRTQTKKNTLQ